MMCLFSLKFIRRCAMHICKIYARCMRNLYKINLENLYNMFKQLSFIDIGVDYYYYFFLTSNILEKYWEVWKLKSKDSENWKL